MARKRRRDRGSLPTWRKNDVGTGAVPRHGTKTTSGQGLYPDMVRKRCRGRGCTPTWRENDVGGEAVSRHGAKTMSGARQSLDMAHQKTSIAEIALEVSSFNLLFICRFSSFHKEAESKCCQNSREYRGTLFCDTCVWKNFRLTGVSRTVIGIAHWSRHAFGVIHVFCVDRRMIVRTVCGLFAGWRIVGH